MAGHYRSTRSGVTSLERLFAPFSGVRVREREPGVLHIRGLAMVEDAVWLEQSPGVFRDSAGEETVVFGTDAVTGSDWLFEANAPAFAYRRLPWLESPPVQAALLAVCALLFLAVPAGWALQASRGRRYGPGTARLAYRLAAALCATNLALLAGLVLLLTSGQQLLFGLPPFTGVIRGLAWVSLAVALRVDYAEEEFNDLVDAKRHLVEQGLAYLEQGQLDEAAAEFQKAIELDPVPEMLRLSPMKERVFAIGETMPFADETLDGAFSELQLQRDPKCPACGDGELPPVRYLRAYGPAQCSEDTFDVRLDEGSPFAAPLSVSVVNGYLLEGDSQTTMETNRFGGDFGRDVGVAITVAAHPGCHM